MDEWNCHGEKFLAGRIRTTPTPPYSCHINSNLWGSSACNSLSGQDIIVSGYGLHGAAYPRSRIRVSCCAGDGARNTKVARMEWRGRELVICTGDRGMKMAARRQQ